MSATDLMVPFNLLGYALQVWEYHIRLGKDPLEAFADTVIDTVSKFTGLVAEALIRQALENLKTTISSVRGG